MTLHTTVLSTTAAMLLLLAVPDWAQAQGTGTIECSSNDGRWAQCPVKNIDPESVTMDRKLSKSDCFRDESWGVNDRGLWVSNGCRAVFAFAYRSSGYAGGRGSSGSIECASENRQRHYCSVPGIDPESVTMGEKLSEANCYKGQTWDADGGGIWVTSGCRARFDFVRHSGHSGWGGGRVSDSQARQACIRRAAREWSVTEANLEATGPVTRDAGTVEFQVKSQRTSGYCSVGSNGQVTNFSTN